MAITANVTNGKLDKTNTTPTQNRKTSSAKASGSNLGYDDFLKLLSAVKIGRASCRERV